MNPLGLEYLAFNGVDPLRFIAIAAAAKCSYISLFVRRRITPEAGVDSAWLMDDRRLRRDVVSCLNDNGIAIGLLDGFRISADESMDVYMPMFDAMQELGITRINALSTEEWSRTVDQVGRLAEAAARNGIIVTIETFPLFTIASVPLALSLINLLEIPNLKLLIDTMHVSRSGDAGKIAEIDPTLIGYVQVSDGPLTTPSPEAYFEEAVHERMIPGEGEMPLVEILRHIPSDIIVSTEVPMRSRRDAGAADIDIAELALAGTRRMLAAAASAS